MRERGDKQKIRTEEQWNADKESGRHEEEGRDGEKMRGKNIVVEERECEFVCGHVVLYAPAAVNPKPGITGYVRLESWVPANGAV